MDQRVRRLVRAWYSGMLTSDPLQSVAMVTGPGKGPCITQGAVREVSGLFAAVTAVIYGRAALCFHSVPFPSPLVPSCVQFRVRLDKSASHMQRLSVIHAGRPQLTQSKNVAVVAASSFRLYPRQLLTEGHSFTSLAYTLSCLRSTTLMSNRPLFLLVKGLLVPTLCSSLMLLAFIHPEKH